MQAKSLSTLGAALIGAAIMWAPQQALAATAAGTVLTNAVTVDYKDGGGTAQTQLTASVNVTVSLVGGVAWGAAPVDQPTSSGDPLAAPYTVTLTNTGNGSDTFTIADGTTESSGNLTAGTFTTTPDEDGGTAGVQLTLFGTISSGAGVYDGTTNTTIPVGNLTVGDLTATVTTVVINGNTYTVAAGSTSTSLVVAGDASADVAAAGVQIGEIATVTYDGTTVGTLSGGTATATHDHSLTATGLALDGNTAATANVTWSTTVNNAVMTVTKYVRNATNANGNTNGVGPTVVNTVTYYTSGVTGNPGDTLEYAIVVANTGSGRGTDVIVTDTFPQFTAYVASSVTVDTNGDGTYDHTLGAGDTEASNEVAGIVETDTGDALGTVLKVYAGVGGVEGAAYAGGTGGEVAGAAQSVILYQLPIQ